MSRYRTVAEDMDNDDGSLDFSSVDIASRQASTAALQYISSPSPSSRPGPGPLQYLTLTLALGGLQFVWSVETGYGTPYLLSLGLKKSLLSLVWLAGPLSGLVTQPLVGALSDRCMSRFGRRRPYIMGATLLVVLCLVVIGRHWWQVLAFYVLDFAINCIQACLRALLAQAWASRMIGVGNVVGYLLGFADLPRLLGVLGDTQLKVLSMLACLALMGSVCITCWFTPEQPLRQAPSARGLTHMFRQISRAFGSLPMVVRRVCTVQLFSWIGWFPFLFYSTTYVAALSDHSDEAEGARAGSFAMFTYAMASLAFSLVLPWLGRLFNVRLAVMWMAGLAVFGVAMLMTVFVESVPSATLLIGVCGFSWAVTIWVPFSIIGEAISKQSSGYALVGDAIPMHELGEHRPAMPVEAGTVLGIHNMYIVVPQFITAFASSLIFAVFERLGSVKHASEIAWVLRLGGVSSLVAVYFAYKLVN
ncbi:MFS general substrate transporter [Linderina pennispora]|uniref:MFS general substrate transporter n=1 Tax=Linderina pennispora TaxID=61395 RepID=A0A1Y1WK53_9FUNG|nr:MFS general substrate transporter [Linderina pennispora]ORX73596.1 MFS general substrate transporter [Linderina pennispora]